MHTTKIQLKYKKINKVDRIKFDIDKRSIVIYHDSESEINNYIKKIELT